MLSAIIATRNSERSLVPTLSALVPAAASGLLAEVIVADAGSEDATAEVADRAVATLELSTLARHAYGLAQAFNQFYHRHPIAGEPDPAIRNRRLAVARIFQREMARLLELLGIPEPGRM